MNFCEVSGAEGKPTLLGGVPGLARRARIRRSLNAEDGAEDTIASRLDPLGAGKDLVLVVELPENDWACPVRLTSQWEAYLTTLTFDAPTMPWKIAVNRV